MLRSTWVLLAALMLLSASADRASAINFTRTLAATGQNDSNGTLFTPDRIQMFLTPGGVTTFSAVAPTVTFPTASGWAYTVSNGGYNAVLTRTSAAAPSPPFTAWNQNFVQSTTNQVAFTVSWTLIALNWSTPNPNDFIFRDTGGGTFVAAAPVAPEPSTLLILGLAAAGAALQARRHGRTAAAVPVAARD